MPSDGVIKNKEVFVDLIAAQIKILSFLAYIVKTFQKQVEQYSAELVQGMLQLLSLCPSEVAKIFNIYTIYVFLMLSNYLCRFLPPTPSSN